MKAIIKDIGGSEICPETNPQNIATNIIVIIFIILSIYNMCNNFCFFYIGCFTINSIVLSIWYILYSFTVQVYIFHIFFYVF